MFGQIIWALYGQRIVTTNDQCCQHKLDFLGWGGGGSLHSFVDFGFLCESPDVSGAQVHIDVICVQCMFGEWMY